MEKKQRDWKFIIGTILLAAVLIVMIGSFWRVVAQQAQLVREEEAREEAEAITAIYVYSGEFLKAGVFVNMETKEVFQGKVPKEGIWNRNDKLIAGDVLEEGDEVKIYGDNVLKEGNPPVYENITRMKRVGRASLEEADVYRKIAANP